MIPLHCPANSALPAAKTQTPTFFSDAESGPQYSRSTLFMGRSKNNRYSPLVTKAFWSELEAGTGIPMEIPGMGYISTPLLYRVPLSRRHYNLMLFSWISSKIPCRFPTQSTKESGSTCNSIKHHFRLTQLP